MRRVVIIVVTAATTVSVLVLGVAIRSHWVRDRIAYATERGDWEVTTYPGRVRLDHTTPSQMRRGFIRISWPVSERVVPDNWFGRSKVPYFAYRQEVRAAKLFQLALTKRGLIVPLWGVFGVIGLPIICMLMKHRLWRGRLKRTLCVQCGYDLRATPKRCPECGTSVRTTKETEFSEYGERLSGQG